VDEVRKKLAAGEKFLFIDTRGPQEWAQSDVKVQGAIHATSNNLDESLSGIPKDKVIVAYCT
jgi:rhodanese-related sulfurtransferase